MVCKHYLGLGCCWDGRCWLYNFNLWMGYELHSSPDRTHKLGLGLRHPYLFWRTKFWSGMSYFVFANLLLLSWAIFTPLWRSEYGIIIQFPLRIIPNCWLIVSSPLIFANNFKSFTFSSPLSGFFTQFHARASNLVGRRGAGSLLIANT